MGPLVSPPLRGGGGLLGASRLGAVVVAATGAAAAAGLLERQPQPLSPAQPLDVAAHSARQLWASDLRGACLRHQHADPSLAAAALTEVRGFELLPSN